MKLIFKSILFLTLSTGCINVNAQFLKDKKNKEDNSSNEKRNKQELNSMFSLGYEGDLSASFGANHFLSDHQALTRLQNRFVPEKIFRKDNAIATIGNSAYRIGKLFLLDYLVNYQIYSTQRLVFGTKYRLDQNGAVSTDVNLKLPAPYNMDKGSVSSFFVDSISPYQQLLNIAGAVEGSSVMADISRKNMFINPDFAYEDAFLFLFSNNDLAAHIALIKDNGYNDIYSYVDQINNLYTDANLSVEKLKTLAILDMGLDPMNIASVLSIGNYIARGKEYTDMLWIKFGEKVKWIPSLKMNLAPFGPELNYQNFLKFDKSMLQLDVHHAVGGYVESMGLDIKALNLLFGQKKKLAVDGVMSLWNQPEISFRKGNGFETFSGIGGSGQVNISYKLLKNRNAFVQGTIGYKSKGYQEGLSLDADLIYKIGFAFR